MSQRDRFIDNSLVRIRSRLNTPSALPLSEAHLAVSPAAPEPVAPAAPVDGAWEREQRQALQRRIDEFRALRRDVAARLTERVAAIPEELRIEGERLEELRHALDKYSALLDQLESIDDNRWARERDCGPAVGTAMRQVEGARLEYLRISAKLAALQRESAAAESPARTGFSSLMPELSSLSWAQGFRLGLCLGLPVIIGVMISALMVALTFILLWK